MFKCKINEGNITYGPKQFNVDDVLAFTIAGELHLKGYRKVSNAYCEVARIDRDDWLDVLARSMHCSRADFYNLDGSGIRDSWRDHYVRCYSKDKHTVSPAILRLMRSYW